MIALLTTPLLSAVEGGGGVSLDEFVVPRVLIAIAVIVIVARLMGRLFARLRQPPVVGEIVGGILLGPTLLGLFPGNLDLQLFPTEIRPFLTVVANLGLVIFMFIVGLELDFSLIKGKGRTAGTISVSSILLPFTLGVLLALGLHGAHDVVPIGDGGTVDVDVVPFVLFIGASMSVTAFPVLARILVDRGMLRVPLGVLALASAAVDDVLAWSLLAVVVAVVDATGVWDLPIILLQCAAFVAVMFAVVRPILGRVIARYRRIGRLTPDILAVFVVGALVSSFITAEIGIHQIFGAFLFGAAIPREGSQELFREVRDRLEHVSVLLLLPVFFVATGLNVDVTGLGVSGLATLVAVIVVACAGKFIGAAVGARATGVPLRKAGAVGVLMNTRGLTELVILGVGLEKQILDPQLFTALVMMAVFTTIITEPLLRLFYTDRMQAADVAEAERSALGSAAAFRVLVHVDELERAGPIVDLAASLAGDERPAEIVLSRFSPPPPATELGGGFNDRLAATAASLDALDGLRAQVEERGLRCVVLARTSADPIGELVTQAAVFGADVVLVDGQAGGVDGDDAGRVLREVGCDVAVAIGARPSRGRPQPVVAVGLGGQTHHSAALELATRTSLGLGAELELLDLEGGRRGSRRTAAADDRIKSLGLPVEVVAADHHDEDAFLAGAPGWDVLFVGLPATWLPIVDGRTPVPDVDDPLVSAAGASTTVVVVRSRETYERDGLGRLSRSRAANVPPEEQLSA